jgi:putative colanic acid biosynthesis glycosyltransferase
MKKILLIDVNCNYTSTGKIVYDLYKEINNRGDLAFIAYGRGPRIDEPNIFKIGFDIETYFHAMMTRITGLTGFFSPISTFKLIRLIKKINPDVIHLHELHGYYLSIGPIMKYIKENHIKTVWTFHCEFMYTGKCGYSEECTRFTENCGNCPLLKDYPKSMFFDFTSFMLKKKREWFNGFEDLTIVTPSEWLMNKVRMSFLKSTNQRVIPNSINTNNFKPINTLEIKESLNLEGKRIILSVIADLEDPRKGYAWVEKIARHLDEKNYSWIIIGGTINNNHTSQLVINVPKIKDPIVLNKYYNLADVFVILSKYENLPTVCLEASAVGTPIVGWNAGGTKEAAIGVESIFYPFGDLEIVEGIIKLSNTNKKENEKRTYLSKERFTRDYYEIY